MHIKGSGGAVFIRCRYGDIGMQVETSEVARRPAACCIRASRALTPPPIIAKLQACTHQWRGDVLFNRQRVASVAWMHHFQRKKTTTHQHCSSLHSDSEMQPNTDLTSIPLVGPISLISAPWYVIWGMTPVRHKAHPSIQGGYNIIWTAEGKWLKATSSHLQIQLQVLHIWGLLISTLKCELFFKSNISQITTPDRSQMCNDEGKRKYQGEHNHVKQTMGLQFLLISLKRSQMSLSSRWHLLIAPKC